LLGRIFISVVPACGIYCYGAWWAMVMLGAAHSTNDVIPAFGYSTVFFLLASLATIAAAPMTYMRIMDEIDGR
jgi:hypothetical protein